jgi:hypothetical protein
VKTLLTREFRRQLPIVVATLFLGALVGFSFNFFDVFAASPYNVALAALLTVATVGPLLLGVASVSPDSENGGEAFLARLPVPRLKVLAVRLGVAALLGALAFGLALVAPEVLFDASILREGRTSLDGQAALVVAAALAVVSFASGAVASVATRRPLVAFVVAPVFAVAPVFLVFSFASDVLGAQPHEFQHSMAAWCLLPGLLFAAAAAAYVRGDLQRPSLRPAAIAVGVIGGGVVLTLAATTTVFAYDVATRAHAFKIVCTSPDGKHFVESELVWGAWRVPGTVAWRIVDRGGGAEEWTSRGMPLGFSPDGRKLLLYQWDSDDGAFSVHLELVDVATGAREQLPIPATLAGYPGSPTSYEFMVTGGTGRTPVVSGRFGTLWRGERPVFLGIVVVGHDRTKPVLIELNGRTSDLPGKIVSWGGSHVLVEIESNEPTPRSQSFAIVDVAREPFDVVPLPLPSSFTATMRGEVSPSGRHVFVLDGVERGRALLHFALPDTGAPTLVSRLLDVRFEEGIVITLDPDERQFVLRRWPFAAPFDRRLFDLVDAANDTRLESGNAAEPRLWSPSGRVAWIGGDLFYDLTTRRAREVPGVMGLNTEHDTALFLDDERVLRIANAKHVVVNLKTGQRTVGDPWAKR